MAIDIMESENKIRLEFVVKSLAGVVLTALLLFLPAGMLAWPWAWAYLVIDMLVIGLTALLVDPELIAERNQRRHADQKAWDRALFGAFGLIIGLLIPLLAGFNVRYDWQPSISSTVQVGALIVYILGWGIHLWSMIANRFFSQVVRIQTDRQQQVVSSGPYRWLRHPGYLGGILLTVSGPLMLGSFWATLAGLVGGVLLIVRTALEDRDLRAELGGYIEYAKRVRWRLLPGIW
jgi:protein-S-isoprenylcysteine O-methyltransferase Ste14